MGGGQQINVCLAASIQLKNMIESNWRYQDKEHAEKISVLGVSYIIISTDDKTYIRDNILEFMYRQEDKAILKQYDVCIKHISRADVPERWTNVLPNSMKLLEMTNDIKAVQTGLVVMKAVVSKYEYEFDEARNPLQEIAQKCFPTLELLAD